MASGAAATAAGPVVPPPEPLFAIRIALLGPTSSGKTTVLNALLGDPVGWVAPQEENGSPSPSSPSVHHYRVWTSVEDGGSRPQGPNPIDALELEDSDGSFYPRSNVDSVAVWADGRPGRSVPTTAKMEMKRRSAAAKAATPSMMPVEEEFHNVPLDDDWFPMRRDTQLVFVDVPGLDLTDDYSCPYAQYVQDRWTSFDCVIVVLDVAMPNHQHEPLLQFLRQNQDAQLQHQRSHTSAPPAPILCVWNKLDDPYDPKHLNAIQHTQQLIRLILNPAPTTSASASDKPATSKFSSAYGSKSTVPFHIFSSSEPYTFGPPMTLPSQSQSHAQKQQRQIQKQTPIPIPEDSYNYAPKHNSTHRNDCIKEPGEGYVVVTKSDGYDQTDDSSASNTQPKDLPISPKQEQRIAFLPLSARTAYIYRRMADNNQHEDDHHHQHSSTFEHFIAWIEVDWMVEKLARELIGLRRWNQLTSRHDQIYEAYHALKQEANRGSALENCGYNAFVRALAQFLAEDNSGAQTKLLESQMESSLRSLLATAKSPSALRNKSLPPPTLLAPQVFSVYTKFHVLYGNIASTEKKKTLTKDLQSAFWTAYENLEVSALKTVLDCGPAYVSALSEPLEQLVSYRAISQALDWYDSIALVTRTMKRLVLQYLQLLLEQESIYDHREWVPPSKTKTNDAATAGASGKGKRTGWHDPWRELCPKDWIQIWSSILLLSYDRYFCEAFAREKLLLEELLDDARKSWKHVSSMALRLCPHCGESLRGCKDEWRCDPCRFAFFTCYPSTLCNGCQNHHFDADPATNSSELHICSGSGYTYSAQQEVFHWMQTSYDRSQQLVPMYPNVYYKIVKTGMIPESLSDANHVGHVFFQYCNLRKLMENS